MATHEGTTRVVASTIEQLARCGWVKIYIYKLIVLTRCDGKFGFEVGISNPKVD